MFKIEIWIHHSIHEEFESKKVEDVVKWYRDEWKYTNDMGGCAFRVYKDDVEIKFDECYKLGFHSDEDDEDDDDE